MTTHRDCDHIRLGPRPLTQEEEEARALVISQIILKGVKQLAMGQFRVEITAVGGHGCQREVKDGGDVYGCGQMGCPDCQTREFIEGLKRKGVQIETATLTHWPGQEGEVVDDLVTRKRKGSF